MTSCAKIVADQPTALDHRACAPPGCKALNENLVWYYDGNRVFRQIARYTRDKSWLAAATECRLYYRSYLNCPAINHYADGWRNFPKGLLLDWTEDRDEISRQDALKLAERGKFSQPQHKADLAGWLKSPASVDISREIAYAIGAGNVAKALGAPEFAGRDPYLDLAHYQLDVWTAYLQAYPNARYPGDVGSRYQPFMFALTAEALIDTYRRPDTGAVDKNKIRQKLGEVARLTYDKLYGAAKHAFMSNTGNPTVFWPAINLLIAPVYGWLWHETGETYFLQAGDTIFADGVVHGWPEVWGGKQFSQNYRWSFDYVAWRNPGSNERML